MQFEANLYDNISKHSKVAGIKPHATPDGALQRDQIIYTRGRFTQKLKSTDKLKIRY